MVRVGYLDFVVESWKPAFASASYRLGECDRDNAVIRVRSDLGRQVKAEVFLHEVLHACYHIGCLSGDDEEKIVSIFAKQLAQVWRDNPDMVEFLSASLRPIAR